MPASTPEKQLSPRGAVFVRIQEGFVDHWYLDAVKVPTIGIGFTWRSQAFRRWWNLNRPGTNFDQGARMSRDEAEKVLVLLCGEQYGAAVNSFMLGRNYAQNVFDGMCSTTFNCGEGALEWKWAAALRQGEIDKGARELERTAITAKGRVLAGLVRRRKEEAQLIRSGIYANVSGLQVSAAPDAMADGVLTRGERGPAVAALIESLTRLNLYTGKKDDLFGFGTEAAVLKFQRAHGLKDDGYAGEKTLAAIKEAIAA